MRAVRCNAYGPLDALVVEDLPAPVAGPGEVVVDVAAAALNFTDVLLVANRYQVSAPLPFTPGSEFAGTVASVGERVDDLVPGDRVSGTVLVGAFAEQLAVPAAALSRVPEGLSLASAAAGGVAHSTAYHALRSSAGLQPGEWLVVLGAAGGVGLAAVQIAHALGAKVLAAASGPAKLDQCRAAGADATVDYSRQDLKEEIRRITGGGADVVFDPVGGEYSEPALRALRWGGRFISIGFASGEIPKIPLNLVLLKGLVLTAFEYRGFARNQPDELARNRAELAALMAEGRLQPHVSATYPLEAAASALGMVAERRAVGKVIIQP
jgi:NADPH2:quinone reductase